jgi:hypothetical protein
VQLDKTGGGGTPGAGGIAGKNTSTDSISSTINRCYAYGNISATGGSDSTGGIVGANYGRTGNTISNCAALNSKVYNASNLSNYQGRVAGSNDVPTPAGTLTNNHAYESMQVGEVLPNLASDKTGTGKGGADISVATLSTNSVTALWTAPGALNWPTFQTTPIEPPDDSTSPWYWGGKTISIPSNDVNTTGVSTVYVPSLWFD